MDIARKKKILNVTREWTEALVVAGILALLIRAFLIQPFKIPSGSMRMTLLEGDRPLVVKLIYGPQIPFTKKRLPGFFKPQRGDVVVFKYPDDPKRDFIKRLIALGGETVEIKNGDIYINDELVEDPVIKNIYYYNRKDSDYGKAGQKVEVAEGFYFMLGDNSGASSDSRFWGFVPEENIVGKAVLIFWPLNRMRFIE